MLVSKLLDDLLGHVIEPSHHVSVEFHELLLGDGISGLEGSCMVDDPMLQNFSK